MIHASDTIVRCFASPDDKARSAYLIDGDALDQVLADASISARVTARDQGKAR
jgi:hypothetical protein